MLRNITGKFILLFFITLLSIILYTIQGWTFIHIPLGWSRYVDQKGLYSFLYPKSWKITDCGNSEIVVAKDYVDICYFPLDASEEYLDKLYFQVFLPKQSIICYPSPSWEKSPPSKLKGWVSIIWQERDDIPPGILHKLSSPRKIRTSIIPVNPAATISSLINCKEKNTTLPEQIPNAYLNDEFRIGFIEKQPAIEDIRKVLRTVKFYR